MQHVQRGRMEGRGARFLGQRWPFLEHRDRNAAACEMSSGDKPDWACPGNEDPFFDRQIVTQMNSELTSTIVIF